VIELLQIERGQPPAVDPERIQSADEPDRRHEEGTEPRQPPHAAGQGLGEHGLDEDQARGSSGMAGAECQGDIGAEAMPRHDGPRIALRVENTRKVGAPFGHSDTAAANRGPLAPEVEPEEIP
jgi:hypothetical protein